MRKDNYILRLKCVFNFLSGKGKNPVRIMTCGRCSSQVIKEIRKPTQGIFPNHPGVKLLWGDKCKCLRCGAEVEEIQEWTW